jgi:hypothetical protein
MSSLLSLLVRRFVHVSTSVGPSFWIEGHVRPNFRRTHFERRKEGICVCPGFLLRFLPFVVLPTFRYQCSIDQTKFATFTALLGPCHHSVPLLPFSLLSLTVTEHPVIVAVKVSGPPGSIELTAGKCSNLESDIARERPMSCLLHVFNSAYAYNTCTCI